MKRATFIIFLVLFSLEVTFTQTGAPKFESYAVNSVYNGKNAKPIITKKDRMFRTRIKWAAEGKRDFAGEYVFVQFGCGMACRGTFALNARTGRVTWLPFSLCCWDPIDADPVAFKLNSRLLAIRGLRNEGTDSFANDKASDVHFYELKNGSFKFIKTVHSERSQ